MQEKYEKILNEIRTGQLYYDYIYDFMNIVNNVTKYNMINPILTPFEEFFERPENETDLNDVQIFYEGDFAENGSKGGHYICTFYVASSKTVYVFDSLFYGRLSNRTKNLLKVRYPKSETNFVKPKTKQPDAVSCGIFSTAYATALIFGYDPAQVPLKIDFKLRNKTLSLRKHLATILSQNRLEMFPSK